MDWSVVAALLATGAVVGVVAGLVGIGGGVLIVPFLYFFYAHPGWSGAYADADLHATLAHATSLLIIVPTAIRGVFVYHKKGLVAWRAALPIALASAVAAVFGARLALVIPVTLLKLCFSLLLIGSSMQLILRGHAHVPRAQRESLPAGIVSGVVVGLFSALLGVGGGLVAIPLLMYVVRLDIRRVAATSLAIVCFAATAGTLTYILSGLDVGGRPYGSLGYVHLWAALPMLPGAVLGAGWGAGMNQRMKSATLRYVFAVVFLLLGVRLLVQNLGGI